MENAAASEPTSQIPFRGKAVLAHDPAPVMLLVPSRILRQWPILAHARGVIAKGIRL